MVLESFEAFASHDQRSIECVGLYVHATHLSQGLCPLYANLYIDYECA